MYDFENQSEELRLKILQTRAEFCRVTMEKDQAVRLQRYDIATDLRKKQNEINDDLTVLKNTLQSDYENLEWLPENFLTLIRINSLLAEFDLLDELLPAKLLAIQQYLQAQYVSALNHNQREHADRVLHELELTQTAIMEETRRKPAEAGIQ